MHGHENIDKITLMNMIDVFIENRTSTIDVKRITLYSHSNKGAHLKSVLSIKLKDFNYPILKDGTMK